MPEILHAALLPVLDVLEELNRRVRDYDKAIEEISEKQHPETRMLRQVRGVGPQVALAFVVAIGDPRDFRDSRDVGAYLGLVPRSFQSGESDPHLGISKQGDKAVRTLLVNVATHILRRSAPDCALKRFGRRVANRGNPRDRARARVGQRAPAGRSVGSSRPWWRQRKSRRGLWAVAAGEARPGAPRSFAERRQARVQPFEPGT